MPKLSLLCFMVCFFTFSANAQQLLKGRVLEDKTRVGLASISVQNLNTKQSAISDNKGNFTIKASLNDVLLFKGFAYENDTLIVTKLNDFEVFMLPQGHVLNAVKVTSMDGPSLIFFDPYFHGQTTAYQLDKNGNFKGGVAFRLSYFKKDEKKRKKLERMMNYERVKEQIAKAFSAKNIAGFVPLKGVELDNFIEMYTPGAAQYLNNDFVMLDYLNTCYKKFMQLSPQKRQLSRDSSIFKQ